MGIADAASWQEVAASNGFEVPEGVDPDKPFVSMVDPATGTGTFLVEWLRRARKSFLDSGAPGEWPEHLRDRLLPSMHAFELMLAPYAIAHLKVALELHTVGAGDGAMQILLTDTLEHAARQGWFATISDPVADEGERAAKLKESQRFTVVVGNPPYDREQRAVGTAGRRKGGVVRYGAESIAPLLNAVTKPMKEAGLGRHLKNVYNDYVYFWRWAIWQATELRPGPGVVAFIAASSYLDGVSMGGVRDLLRAAFDELWIVDLGGDGRGVRNVTDENIFDIQTPVAIAVGVRTGREPGERCKVRYLRITGTRPEKLVRLHQISLSDATEMVPGNRLDRMTPRKEREYNNWPEITDLFPWIHSGCQMKRTWPIGESQALLSHRWRALLHEVPRNRGSMLKETRDRSAASNPLPILTLGSRLRPLKELDRGEPPEGIERYGYRSLDRQWVIADHRVGDYPRPDLWRVHGPQQVFLTSLTSTRLGQGPSLIATPYVPDLDHFRGSYGAKNVMPLYRDQKGRESNVPDGLLVALSDGLGIEAAAEDLLAYAYAVGGTSAFHSRYNEALAEAAGPIRIPITADPDLFQQAVELGRDLLWRHTWGERFAPAGQSSLPAGQAKAVRPVEGMPEAHAYDPESQTLTVGTGAVSPVSEEAWNFEVSGLRVLRSWLAYRMKTRKGRKSSPLDDIRPTRWTQTNELLLLLSIIEHTIEVTPKAADLLAQIVKGPLIPAKDLPTPTPANRKPPKRIHKS